MVQNTIKAIKAVKAGKAKILRDVPYMVQILASETGSVPTKATVPENGMPCQNLKDDSPIDSCIKSFVTRANIRRKEDLKRGIRKGRATSSGWTSFETVESKIASLSTDMPLTIPKASRSSLETIVIGSSSETEDPELHDELYARPSPLQVQWAAVALTENGVNSQRVIDQMFRGFKWNPNLLLQPR